MTHFAPTYPEQTARALALDQELRAAAAAHHRTERDLAVLLAQMADHRLYQALGFSTLTQYADEILDLSARQVRALLAIGRRLPDLPDLDRALADGKIGWTKARELLRVVTPENAAAWVARAASVSSRDLEAQVASVILGDDPPDADEVLPGPARRRITFEVESADADVIDRMFALLAAQTGGEVDRGAALAAIARDVLARAEGDDAPTGEAPYQVVLQHCPECRRTVGADSEISDTIASESGCDHELVDLTDDSGPSRGRRTRAIPPRVRRAVLATWGQQCVVPGCRCRLWLDLHHVDPFGEGGGHDEINLVPICTIHHRLQHEGVLALWRDADGVHVELPDGRHLFRRDPRGSPSTAGPSGA